MPSLTTTCVAFSGGVGGTAGTGKKYRIEVTDDGVGTWELGDAFTLTFTFTLTEAIEQFGAGDASGQEPTFALTFADKMYLLAGEKVFISDTSSATSFNNPQGTGNDVITMTNFNSSIESWIAAAPYQGKVAFFSGSTILIWSMQAYPVNNQLLQTLENVGTIAPASVKAIGDLDVLFLANTGIRSLRVRDSSNNAFVNDIGSPIDSLITAAVAAATDATSAQAIVEPGSRRYWLFLDGTIYVLSFFPTNKIVAWSTYTPSFAVAGTQTEFTPEKFVVYGGSIYCRDTNGNLVKYGDGYDNTQAEWALPWTSGGDPDDVKQAERVQVSCKGSWIVYGSMNMDDVDEVVVVDGRNTRTPDSRKDSTYRDMFYPFSAAGTHFRFRAVSNGSNEAVFSAISLITSEKV